MAIFGPIWTQFRSKQRKIQPGSHICSQFDPIESSRSDRVESIRSSRSNRVESIRSSRFDPIESIRSEMASWSNDKLFRAKLSPNRTKNVHFIEY